MNKYLYFLFLWLIGSIALFINSGLVSLFSAAVAVALLPLALRIFKSQHHKKFAWMLYIVIPLLLIGVASITTELTLIAKAKLVEVIREMNEENNKQALQSLTKDATEKPNKPPNGLLTSGKIEEITYILKQK